MRVTKHMLEVRLGRINRTVVDGVFTGYQLNNAPCYGGWQLTCNDGSTIIQHRLPPKQMLNYLDGVIIGLDMGRYGAVK
jgi:hypothetical protein